MRPLLVLRPEPGASATAERARKLGLDPVVLPLFDIEAMEWTAPDPRAFDALLLTSANAIRTGGPQLDRLRGLPVHAVGQATADAARAAGFEVATRCDAGVERLLDSLAPDLELLHLCGEDRREADGAAQSIMPLVVYRSKALPDVNLSAAEGAVVLIHSPRAGRRFAELVDAVPLDRRTMAIAAVSAAAAGAVGGEWGAVEIAERPTDDALLALAARLCNKPAPQ
jgi:uroporphyrinogen-III synthase